MPARGKSRPHSPLATWGDACQGQIKAPQPLVTWKIAYQGQIKAPQPLVTWKIAYQGQRGQFLPLAERKTGSPGAEIGQCAPGSAKRLVAGNGGKQGGRADGLSRARVFPTGPISARGKHRHPAGLFYWVLLFPTTYICCCRHTRSPLSNDPHCGHLRRLLIFALSLIRRNRFLLIYAKTNKSANYKDITNQKCQLYPSAIGRPGSTKKAAS